MQRAMCSQLDQGIIKSVKAGFRKAQLQPLLTEYELWVSGKMDDDKGTFKSKSTHTSATR